MPIPFPQQSRPSTRGRSDSYPSLASSSEASYDSEEEAALIQEEWEESLRQIEVVLSIILIPTFGRWYGRRFSYWVFARWQQLGWTRALFGLT